MSLLNKSTFILKEMRICKKQVCRQTDTFYKGTPQLLLQADGAWYKQTGIMFHSLHLITHPHSSQAKITTEVIVQVYLQRILGMLCPAFTRPDSPQLYNLFTQLNFCRTYLKMLSNKIGSILLLTVQRNRGFCKP